MKEKKELTIEELGTRRTIMTTATLCIAEAIIFVPSILVGIMQTGLGMLETSIVMMCVGALSMQKAAEIFDKKHPIPERGDEANEEQK